MEREEERKSRRELGSLELRQPSPSSHVNNTTLPCVRSTAHVPHPGMSELETMVFLGLYVHNVMVPWCTELCTCIVLLL